MVTEIFKVFYQSSTDLVESLGEVMGETEGFTMVDDEKNNQIIITGTYAQLNQAENILNKIDLEKKQVMIEAYIVNATDGFNKNFSANIDALNAAATANGKDRITFSGIDTNPGNTTSITPVADTNPEAISNAVINYKNEFFNNLTTSSTSENNNEITYYRIQIAASNKLLELKPYNFKGLKSVDVVKEGKIYKYLYGKHKTLEDANESLKTARISGFNSSFVVRFQNNEIIRLN